METSLKTHKPKNGDPIKGESIKKFQFARNDTIDSGFDEKYVVNIKMEEVLGLKYSLITG